MLYKVLSLIKSTVSQFKQQNSDMSTSELFNSFGLHLRFYLKKFFNLGLYIRQQEITIVVFNIHII